MIRERRTFMLIVRYRQDQGRIRGGIATTRERNYALDTCAALRSDYGVSNTDAEAAYEMNQPCMVTVILITVKGISPCTRTIALPAVFVSIPF